jgi:hypothetical protein
MNCLSHRMAFRFRSTPAGNIIKLAIFYIVKNVVAVDGGGGIEYSKALSKALNAQYEGSSIFQRMILDLNVSWMV